MIKKIIVVTSLITLMCSSFFISPIIAAPTSQKSQSNETIEKKVQSNTPLTSSNSTKGNIEKVLSTKNASSKNTQNATLKNEKKNSLDTANTSTAALDLILKSIQLSQGEKGSELWRLNAKAAQMEQLKESFIVEAPKLTYTMKPNNTKLYVSSKKGTVNQKEQVLQFKENVLIDFMDNTLKSNTLVYNGAQKVMVFPEGGSFFGKNIKGTAGVILWHLDTLKVEAKNNVSITFSSKVPLN